MIPDRVNEWQSEQGRKTARQRSGKVAMVYISTTIRHDQKECLRRESKRRQVSIAALLRSAIDAYFNLDEGKS